MPVLADEIVSAYCMYFSCLLEMLKHGVGPFKMFTDKKEIDPVGLVAVNTRPTTPFGLLAV